MGNEDTETESINDYLLPEYKAEFLKKFGRAFGINLEEPIYEKNKFSIGSDGFVHTHTYNLDEIRAMKHMDEEYIKTLNP